MKKTFKPHRKPMCAVLAAIVVLVTLFGFVMTGCSSPHSSSRSSIADQIPDAEDYAVGNLSQSEDDIMAVTVTPHPEKSTGARTIWYEGISPTVYERSQELPAEAGEYEVTFDVAKADGWEAIEGLFAGILEINPVGVDLTPEDTDFAIGNLSQWEGSVTPVTIVAHPEKSTGHITIWYEGMYPTVYERSQTLPQEVGEYEITFDVAKADGWKAINGLVAPVSLKINPVDVDLTPEAADFAVGNLSQREGSVTHVTIVAHPEKTTGHITIWYQGISPTVYERSRTLPSAAGTYEVTFDVAKAEGWEAISGLPAGTLEINPLNVDLTPEAADFTVSNLSQRVGEVTAVTIAARAGKSTGNITIWYTGIYPTEYERSKTLPEAVGEYEVTFDVEATEGWKAVTGLDAGILEINPVDVDLIPEVTDFTVGNLNQMAGEVTAVTITPKDGKSGGEITIWYEGIYPTEYERTQTVPQAAGEYEVTFDVGAIEGWQAEHGLPAETLVIEAAPVSGGGTETIVVDFEGTEWAGTGSSAYASRTVNSGGRSWKVSGITNPMIDADVYTGTRGIRFRGNVGDSNGIELTTAFTSGIQSIAFDYGSAGTATTSLHSGGVLIVSTQVSGSSTWTEVGRVTAPSWADGGSVLQKANFNISMPNSVRFKIDKVDASGNNTVCVDNIAIIIDAGDDDGGGTTPPVDPGATTKTFTVDFETGWGGNAYAARNVTWGGYDWRVSAVINKDNNDHVAGNQGLRFRGNTSDTGDSANRIELVSYLSNGIKSISFDYGSYGTHSNGTIVLYTQTNGSSTWTEAGRVTAPAWGGSLLNKQIDLNVTSSARFKIEKVSAGGSTSVNVDNIVVTYYE